MFTGLIESVGKVVKVERLGAAARLFVASRYSTFDVAIGDSVAVNGACLTLTAMEGGVLTFDVSLETLSHCSLRRVTAGVPVNLERALRLSDRLGGHLVTGHVDCVSVVLDRREVSGHTVFSFGMTGPHLRHLAPKGSVTIDGVSLTVNTVSSDRFGVNVIPHTAASTTLVERRVGDEVNIETDILAKYVERLLSGNKTEAESGLSLDVLERNGFA